MLIFKRFNFTSSLYWLSSLLHATCDIQFIFMFAFHNRFTPSTWSRVRVCVCTRAHAHKTGANETPAQYYILSSFVSSFDAPSFFLCVWVYAMPYLFMPPYLSVSHSEFHLHRAVHFALCRLLATVYAHSCVAFSCHPTPTSATINAISTYFFCTCHRFMCQHKLSSNE